MKKEISILIVLLFAVQLAYAQQVKIDDDNRVVSFPFVKDAVFSFTFYGDPYQVELGSFDFDHNRVTVEMHPQLGTDIINLNAATEWDLDLDDENDMALTLVSLDPNAGSNDKGEVGTAVIRIESLKPITLEETTVTTSLATTIERSTSNDDEDVESSSLGGLSTSMIAIIVGIVVGLGIIIFLLKDKLKTLFKGGAGSSGGQQTPTNYKQPVSKGGGQKCSKCGKDIAPGAKFCNNCGAKTIEKKKFCPECGTEYKGGKFCNNCGHKMM